MKARFATCLLLVAGLAGAAGPLDLAEEVLAYENMARAAENGSVQALGLLAAHYGDKVGQDNHGKAERLFAMHQGLADATNYRSWLALVKHWGATLVSPQLMRDSMGAAIAVARATQPGCTDVIPQKLVIASGLRSAVYLPLEHPALEESYLIGGEWTEHWTFSVCGALTTVEGSFRALGGNAFSFTFRKTG